MFARFTNKHPLSLPPPGLADRSFAGVLLIALASVLICSGCRNKAVIPDQTTAQQQFEFANQHYQQYMSPLMQRSGEKDRYARVAEAAFQKVIDRFPEEKTLVGRARLGIALIHKTQGKERRALRSLRDIIKEYHDDDYVQAWALFETGNLLDDLGKHREAKKYFNEIRERYGGTLNPLLQTLVLQSEIKYQKIWEK